MKFGERAALFILRPFYHVFFERPLWWFLAKVKEFFFAEVGVRLGNIERLADDAERRLAAIEERLRRVEAANAAQWDALEELLLALFHQPETRPSGSDKDVPGLPEHTANVSATNLSRVHAASNIR